MAGTEVIRTSFGGVVPNPLQLSARLGNTRNILMELRKICQHPYLSAPLLEDETAPAAEYHKRLTQASGKLVFLKQLLPKLKERGHRVLLFSQFKIALDRIEDFLVGEGVKYLRLDGDMQQAVRQKAMDQYNAPGSDIFCFLLTTRAGGVGVNLFTADTVIIHDPDFNPHQDLQAIARSHRFGQKKPVLVFKLMVKDSVEEQIVFKGKKKMVLDHLVVQNLNSTDEDVDIDSIIMHGAKALYEKNEDAGKERGIVYNSKNIDEMIDQMERQAEAEGEVLAEKWRLEDEARERGEKAEASKEARTFGFAKIWEVDQGEAKEVDDVLGEDEEMEEAQGGLEEPLKHANANKGEQGRGGRSRQISAAELAKRQRAEQYAKELEEALAMEATPIKKKKGRKGKGKGKGKMEDEEQGSDADFAIINGGDSSDSDYGGGGAGAVAMEVDDIGMSGTDKVLGTKGIVQRQHGAGAGIPDKAAAKALRRAQKKQEKLDAAAALAAAGPSEPVPDFKPSTTLMADIIAKREKRRLDKLNRQAIAAAAAAGLDAPLDTSLGANNPTLPSSPAISAPSRSSVPPAAKSELDAKIRTQHLAKLKEGQDILQWLYHLLGEFVVEEDMVTWAKICLTELPSAEREGYYNALAKTADARLLALGYDNFFSMIKARESVARLIRSKTPALPSSTTTKTAGAMLPFPKGMGRGTRAVLGETGTPAANGGPGPSSVATAAAAAVASIAASRISTPSKAGAAGSAELDTPALVDPASTISPRRSLRGTPSQAPDSAKRVPVVEVAFSPLRTARSAPTPTPTTNASSTAGPSSAGLVPPTSIGASSSTSPLPKPTSSPVLPIHPTRLSAAQSNPSELLCAGCAEPGHSFFECERRPPPDDVRKFRDGLLDGTIKLPDKDALLVRLGKMEKLYRAAGVDIPPFAAVQGGPSAPQANGSVNGNATALINGLGRPPSAPPAPGNGVISSPAFDNAALNNKRGRPLGSKKVRTSPAVQTPSHPIAAEPSSKRPRLDPRPPSNPHQPPPTFGHPSPMVSSVAQPMSPAQLAQITVCAICGTRASHQSTACPVLQGASAVMRPILEHMSPMDPMFPILSRAHTRAFDAKQMDRHFQTVFQRAGHDQLQQQMLSHQYQLQQQQRYLEYQAVQDHHNLPLRAGQWAQQPPQPPPHIAPMQAPTILSPARQHAQPQPQSPLQPRAPPQPKQQEGPICHFCQAHCGRDLKACADVHGGRKAVKALIKELDQPDKLGQESHEARLTPLYDLYKTWPK